MDARAHPCVFLGYPFAQKGYKVFDLVQKKVIVSRHIIFHEFLFPFKKEGVTEVSQDFHTFFPAAEKEGNQEENRFSEILQDAATVPQVPQVPKVPATVPELLEPLAYPDFSDCLDPEIPTLSVSQVPAQSVSTDDRTALRRSCRPKQPPLWQKDYICSVQKLPKSPHLLSKVLHYDACTATHKHFLLQISSTTEPRSYAEASKNSDWMIAMENELQALEANKTWDFAFLPQGKQAIGCKWVYKIKYKSDGTIERYKARLVAKGYTQTHGLDYHETFAPVVKMTTVRLMLAIAASKAWPLFQLDVNNAFLHGFLDEEIYMKLPPGFYDTQKKEGKVCRLLKSLYGLKQASRQWFSRFSTALLDYGFQASKNDSSLFVLHKDSHLILLLVYVDDVLLTGTCCAIIDDVKSFLDAQFRIKDLGTAKFFLGIELARSTSGIFINQRKYTLDILQEFGYTESKPCNTPMDSKHCLGLSTAQLLLDPEPYRRLVGKLIYLTVTRPDLAYPVHILSQFISNPTEDHMRAAHRVLRYLKGAPGQGIFFSAKSDLCLRAYCDADWAACPVSRRSLSGYCVLLGTSLVSWKTKKQATVSRSSAESEYRSMAQCCSEIMWLLRLLQDMGVSSSLPIPLFCDNKAAIHLAHNPVFHERTKHIEIDCHFIREQVIAGTILPHHISTTAQPADVFTKALSKDLLHLFMSKLSVSNFLHNPACGGVLKMGM